MIQVDEESRIQFYDGNQGPKQCTSQVEPTPHQAILNDAKLLNCVLRYGHEGLHESHDGDTVWRDRIVRDVFKRTKTTVEV